ncbi:MAG: peptidase C39 [Microcystaceae cyanobacterium]
MSISLMIIGLIGLILGAIFGKHLAKKGVTADNALSNHQGIVRVIFFGLVIIVAILVGIEKLHFYYQLPKMIPVIFTLWLQANIDKLLFGFSSFVFGFLLCLELSGWSSRQRRNQLLVGLSIITLGLVTLSYLFSPIIEQIQPLKLTQGIVRQTTPVSCAPASIATLARLSGKHPTIGEKEVALLTKTNRLGTSTLREIAALKKLDLNPEYHHTLIIEDLMKRNQMALLHVRERLPNNKKLPHAVALLAIQSNPPTLIIGNPLFGIDKRPIEKMKGYWFGEAIFINSEVISIDSVASDAQFGLDSKEINKTS